MLIGGKFYDVAAFGDSLTNGTGASLSSTVYPYVAANYVIRRRFLFRNGVGGQTSTQIAVRQGGAATTATISGGQIPASGGVTVTFPVGYEPATTQGPFQDLTNGSTPTIFGTISGVYGSVTLSGAVYTFTRMVSGSIVSVSSAQFVPDTTPWTKATQLLWAGINNSGQQSQIIADHQAMIANIPHGRYLGLSLINGGAAGEAQGQSGYNTIIADNVALASLYGPRSVDVRTPLVAAYDSNNIGDVFDHANDTVPFTCRAQNLNGTISAIGLSDTTFTTSVAVGVGYVLLVDSEYIYVSGVSGTTITNCVRGYYGSTAASHASNAAFAGTDPRHLSDKGYAVVGNTTGAALAALNI